MIDNAALPRSNDTKEILAAIDTWFFSQGQVKVVTSDFPVNHSSKKPYPESVSALTILEVSGITLEQARRIHGSIGSEKRMDVWKSGSISYIWSHSSGPTITLVKPAGEDKYLTIFPLLYVPVHGKSQPFARRIVSPSSRPGVGTNIKSLRIKGCFEGAAHGACCDNVFQ